MANDVAAAICAMAAPSFHPFYINAVVVCADTWEEAGVAVASLVLHVCPRPGSPRPEVAVFKGEVHGGLPPVILKEPAATYDIPGSTAGLVAFLEDLVKSTRLWMADQEGLLQLSQPVEYGSDQAVWLQVNLSLCLMSAVEVTHFEGGGHGVKLKFPPSHDQQLACMSIRSRAAAFKENPGSSRDRAEDYKRLRDEDVRMLAEAFAVMYRQGSHYRGQLGLPAVTVGMEA
ncbi:hypothetical protein N2152v2_003339 [Parachlorella kessleri]